MIDLLSSLDKLDDVQNIFVEGNDGQALKPWATWFFETFLPTRGYTVYNDKSLTTDWYWGIKKSWTNRWGVVMEQSQVVEFEFGSNDVQCCMWDVAETDPDSCILLADTAPVLVTLNVLELMNNSSAVVEALIANRLPDDKRDGSNRKPPIDPLLACILTAFISPPILADDAVTAPLLVTLNSLEDINNS